MFKCPIMILLECLSFNILRVSLGDMSLSSKFSLHFMYDKSGYNENGSNNGYKNVIKTPAVKCNVHWSIRIKIREWKLSFK